MSLFDRIQLPKSPAIDAVRAYLEAESAKDFSRAAEFFAEDVQFNGLILKVSGRAQVAAQMEGFLRAAVEYIRIEAVAEVESGAASRVMALYWFKAKPSPEPQILCDHLTVVNGKITRIDNVFDAGKLPPM